MEEAPMDDMDDDLTIFRDTTDRSLGNDSDDTRLNPTTRIDHPDGSQQSILRRIAKATTVLLFGRFNNTRYAGRDRLAILLKIGAAGLVFGTLTAVAFDYSGIHSGPLWQFQVFIRDMILQGFTIAGEVGIQLVNNPLMTLLVILASATLIRTIQ